VIPGFLAEGSGGTPLLFLHGIGGNAESFRAQLAHFGRARRTLAWTMPGYGGTPALVRTNFASLADSVLRLFDAERIERGCVVGHSLGGFVAQELASRAPGRLAGLVLYSTTAAFGRPHGEWQREFIAQRLAPLQAGRSMAEIAPGLIDGLVSTRASPEARKAAVASMAAVPTEAYRAALQLLVGFDRRELLPRLAMPTLLIAGAEDRTAPAEVMRRMAEKIRDAEIVVFDGVGHLAHLEAADAFNRAIDRFLARIERKA
jgi:3-oxoadipate enol-lactonase